MRPHIVDPKTRAKPQRCCRCGGKADVIRDGKIWCAVDVPLTPGEAEWSIILAGADDAELEAVLDVIQREGSFVSECSCEGPNPLIGVCDNCDTPKCGSCLSLTRDGFRCDDCRWP